MDNVWAILAWSEYYGLFFRFSVELFLATHYRYLERWRIHRFVKLRALVFWFGPNKDCIFKFLQEAMTGWNFQFVTRVIISIDFVFDLDTMRSTCAILTIEDTATWNAVHKDFAIWVIPALLAAFMNYWKCTCVCDQILWMRRTRAWLHPVILKARIHTIWVHLRRRARIRLGVDTTILQK